MPGPSTYPPPCPNPPRRRWLFAVFAASGVLVSILAFALREPRFEGRPLTAWLDSMGTTSHEPSSATIRQHPVRQKLQQCGDRVLAALEDEILRSAARLERSQSGFFRRSLVWAHLGRFLPGNLGLAPPQPNDPENRLAEGRILWATGLLMDLSPDWASGLKRLDSIADRVPSPVLVTASKVFGTLDDRDGSLASHLVARLRSRPLGPDHRVFWISCLGHLRSELPDHVDLVRSLTRDAQLDVRTEAIRALGFLDRREDAPAFIRAAVSDTPTRQAAMVAYQRMGPRALSVESFIRATVQDRDWLTSFFAQSALKQLTTESNLPPSP